MSAGRERTDDIRNDVTKIKRLLGLDVARLALSDDFEGTQYTPLGVNVIEFVNVSTSIAAAQTGSGGPAQVTGLSAVVNSSTQITLSWTGLSGVTSYNVYSSNSAGVTGSLIGNVTSPGAVHSGLSAATTYYYQVAGVNAVGEGPLSSQISASTSPLSLAASLDLQLNNNFTDSSPNAYTVAKFSFNGFGTPGAFGSHGWLCNTPGQDAIQADNLRPANTLNPTNLQMDVGIGFSVSLWIRPTDISALSFRRVIMEKPDSPTQKWSLQIDSSGIVYFFVKKAGTDYKAQVSGFTTGSTWQHLAATFNGSTNTAIVYRNAVAGSSSSATPQYPGSSDGSSNSSKTMILGYRQSTVAPDIGDGDGWDTIYKGSIDEVKYYRSQVLTPTQITNLKNTNAP